MRVGWMVLGLLASASVGWAQATLPVPTNPLTVCISQVLPPASSYQLVFDNGAPEAVTVTAADAAKCKTSDTGSFTVAAARWTAGQHTLRLNAVNAGGTTPGPVFTVTIQAPKPGEPVITGVVAGVVVPPAGATLATYGLTAGSATFGLALPQGASSAGVRLGALSTQTDVKTRWADGSIRFAVVSAQVPSAGQYAVTESGVFTMVFTPTWPSASVTFTISGVSCVAALPAFSGADTWLAGSVVRESRVMVTPRCGSTDHPLLQVLYDVRSYASGGHRIDVTVQNVKDVTAGNSVSYDLTVTIGGQSVFARSNVTHAYLTRWRKVFTTGGLTEAAVTPDVEPFYASRAVPRFHPQVTNQVYNTLPDTPCQPEPAKCYDILKFGDMSMGMGSPGGRPEIAPYPDWVARYLVHKQPSARAYMLRHADLSGSWSGHITKGDGSLIRLDEWKEYWLDGRAGTNPTGPNATRNQQGFLQGMAEGLEVAHLPSLTYVPYLLTGDRYYLDQQKLWSQFVLLSTWPGDGGRYIGGATALLYQHQPRGFGWGLRVLGEMTAFLPDDDPYRSYFRARVDENLGFLDRQPLDDPGGPLAVPFVKRFGPDGDKVASTSMWQVSYIGYAVDRLRQLGSTAGAAFLKHAAAFQVRLFTSAPDYPPIYGAPYYPKVGRWTGTGATATVTEWFTMSQMYAVNFKSGGEPPQPLTGYYGPETRILLLIAQAQAIPKADEALNFLSNQPGVMSDIYGRSGWAIASVGK
jgi:hypothetical protein